MIYAARHSRLSRYLAAIVVGLTAYVCLYPFVGWREMGQSPLAFLGAPWPRYYTWLDLVLNVLGFVPLGFSLAVALARSMKPGWRVLVVTLLGGLLSLGVEFAQNYLPTRVASNLDVGTNIAGALMGALIGVYVVGVFHFGETMQRWRQRRIVRGHIGEWGLLLMAAWCLAQLEPSNILFGVGDLRPLLDLPPPLTFSASRYIVLEALIVATQTLALGLIARRVLREPLPWLVALVIALGLLLKSLAGSLFLVPADVWSWASPGAWRGLLMGVLLLLMVWRLPAWALHAAACVALLVATALVNLAPINPFDMASMHSLKVGHYTNLSGLTRVLASIWPYLALFYLTARGAIGRAR